MNRVWIKELNGRDCFELNVNTFRCVTTKQWVEALFENAQELMSPDETPPSYIRSLMLFEKYANFLNDYYSAIYDNTPLDYESNARFCDCLLLYHELKDRHNEGIIPDVLGLHTIELSRGAMRGMRYIDRGKPTGDGIKIDNSILWGHMHIDKHKASARPQIAEGFTSKGDFRTQRKRNKDPKKQLYLPHLLAVMLLLAWLDMPYGYYQFLRLSVAAYAAYSFIQHLRAQIKHRELLLILSAGIFLLYQPILKVPLTRDIWQWVNLAAVCTVYIIGKQRKKERQNTN